ncbi:MAG: hypothetical protein ACTHMP_04020, partial [Thermomicrobiales bacterium]
MNDRIGEIIETSTVDFWAESAVLHDLPPLGALVAVQLPDELTLYGAVAFGQTGGIDPGRKAVRRGNDDVYDAAIYAEHPELNRILRTTFRVATIGYAEPGGSPRHHLPPCPPPLHYSVLRCDAGAVRAFTEMPRYFPILAASDAEVAPEQLLAAHIRAVWRDRGRDDAWLAAAGRQVARLFKRDYDRLVTVLEAIDPGDWSPPQADARLNGHDGKH